MCVCVLGIPLMKDLIWIQFDGQNLDKNIFQLEVLQRSMMFYTFSRTFRPGFQDLWLNSQLNARYTRSFSGECCYLGYGSELGIRTPTVYSFVCIHIMATIR